MPEFLKESGVVDTVITSPASIASVRVLPLKVYSVEIMILKKRVEVIDELSTVALG